MMIHSLKANHQEFYEKPIFFFQLTKFLCCPPKVKKFNSRRRLIPIFFFNYLESIYFPFYPDHSFLARKNIKRTP